MRMKMPSCHGLFFFGLVIITITAFQGCARGELSQRSDFHFSFPMAMGSLNPILATDLTAYHVLPNIHEGLTTFNANSEVILGLLAQLNSDDDGLRHELILRDDIFFSDGTPITSHDVVASWFYVMNPATAAPFSHFFSIFEGATAYMQGDASSIPHIIALDNYRIEIRLTRRYPFLLALLANPNFAILSANWRLGREDLSSTSGAYRIVERLHNGNLVLEPNPYHYAYDPQMLQRVRLSIIPNAQVAHQFFRNGALDWQARNVALAAVRQDNMEYFLHRSLPNGTFFIAFNHERAPFDDWRVRSALSLSIDRLELADLLEERPQANSYLTPFDRQSYSMLNGISEATLRAQQLLAEAGYSEENPLVIRYYYSASMMDRVIATYLIQRWQNLLPVRLEANVVEQAIYRGMWGEGNFDMIRVSWFVGEYEDAMSFLHIFTPDSSFIQMNYRNEHFLSLLARANEQLSLNQRQAYLEEAEHFLMQEDFAAIALFSPSTAHLYNNERFTTLMSSRRDLHLLRFIRAIT